MAEELHLDNIPSGDMHHPSDLRILLLGNKAAGKSSSGNTILGKQEFSIKSAQCVKRWGEVAGRRITVVEAPGWWRNYLIKDTPALHTEEIVLSTSLCCPGPHAVLIVVRLDSDFTDIHRNAIEERIQLLGTGVWNHSILLFTYGDSLRDTSIEEHIKNKGEALKWLIKNCQKRYHVFDNENRSDNKQVMELLQKIDEMVAKNSGVHFEVDYVILLNQKLRRKAQEIMVKKRQEIQEQDLTSKGHMQSELRIVLVGHRYSGKSSTGNTILGKQEFDTRRSFLGMVRQGEAAGRKVTVVEAPGWWNNYVLKDSPNLYKQEFVLSVALCPPGPHVVLVVIRADGSFTPINGKAIKEHLELLTKRVWKHTIVLFTYGDWLGNTTIEQHIESEGGALKCLIDNCGNQYHVFNNKDGDNTQVTELLEKIEKMVFRNDGLHFEPDEEFLQRVKEEKRKTEECVKQRMLKVKNKSETQIGDEHFLPELGIVLLGPQYSGKTSAGNTILGNNGFVAKSVHRVTQRAVAKRRLTVVDTPGWQQTMAGWIKCEICHSVTLCSPGPHALLLVIQADTSFTEAKKCDVEKYMTVLGDSVWNHTIVLFTCGDLLGDTTIEQLIESEGKALQWLLEACRNRYHVFNNMIKGEDNQVLNLLGKIEEMVTENGGHFVKEFANMGGITAHNKDAFDLHIKDNESIHHPPNLGAYDRSPVGSGYYSQVLLPGSSQSGSFVKSLSSGIGSLREQRLKAFYKKTEEKDSGSLPAKTSRCELDDKPDLSDSVIETGGD